MALTPNFTATQIAGSPSEIVLTDTSTGSDGAITSRRVYVQQSNGEFLVQSGTSTEYEVWDYADSSITLDLLTKDVAVRITVQWLDVSNVVLYDKTINTAFTLYNETFDYGLTQLLAANPLLINDNSFWQNKAALRTDIDSGNNALELADDLVAAQSCYDKATELRLNSQYYYNGNQ